MVMEETNSLASLLGGQARAPINPQPVVPVTVNWLKTPSKKVSETTSSQDEAESVLAEILDPTKVKTVLQFNKACKTFLDVKCKTAAGRSSRMANAALILANVADRCADKRQKRFWPKKSLLSIIAECHVAASSCASFVTLAIEMEDADVVQCCVEHMQDIPDSLLTKCLQFYIRHFEGTSINGSRDTTEDETTPPSTACPLTSPCAQCVNKVLCSPFNDTFIIDNLRQLNFDEALLLLRYLHYLMSKTPASTQDDCIPTLNTLADWIGSLLDAHYTQLLLSHEARDLLTELAQSVQTQELFYTELEAVKAILQSFEASESIPVRQKAGSYSIDLLSM